MTAAAFIFWVLAYSASLLVAGLCLWVWVLVREQRVLWLLAILVVMSLTSFVSLVLPMVLPWGRVYPVILLEVVSLYTLVVPAFVSSCRGLPMWRQLPFYYLGALVVFNLLYFLVLGMTVFFIYPLFFLAPFLFDRRKARQEWSDPLLLEGPESSASGAGAADADIEPRRRSGLLSIEGTGTACCITILTGSLLFAGLMWSPLRSFAALVQGWYALVTLVYLSFPALWALNRLRSMHWGRGSALASGQLEASPANSLETAFVNVLSPREREVASLLVAGKTYQEIADSLFVSLSAIKKHATTIYRKTGTRNARELGSRSRK